MTLAVTDSGHLSWPLRSLTGREAVRARCLVALTTIQGERPEDTRIGLPEAWIEGRPVSPAQVQAVIRSQLRRVTDVRTVQTVTVADSSGERRVAAEVVADTVDGLVRLTIGAPMPYDTRGPAPWYKTSGTLKDGRGPSWTGR